MKTATRPMMLSIWLVLIMICCNWIQCQTGCWSQFGSDETHSFHTSTSLSPPLIVSWEKPAERVAISGSPVANENRMALLFYLGTLTSDYSLQGFTLDGSGLHFQWHVSLSGIQLGTSPAIAGSNIICPSNCNLSCFRLEDGEKVWEVTLDSQPLTPVILDNASKVAGTTLSGKLFLVDVNQGNTIWIQRNLEGDKCHFFDIPTGGDGRIFVCYTTENEQGIAAFDMAGKLLWTKEAELQSTCVNECSFIILYMNGILYAIDESGMLCALDSGTGETQWTYSGKTLLGIMSSDGENLYVYSKTDEGVICLSARTGAESWESSHLFPGEKDIPVYVYKSIVSTQGHVFVCRYSILDIGNTQIIALDRQTGERVWESEQLEGLEGPLIVCKSFLIASTASRLIGFGSQIEPVQSAPPETASPSTIPASPKPGGPPLVSEWYYLVAAAGIIIALVVYILRRKK
jgi:outer membrane protein assembly factor BamB